MACMGLVSTKWCATGLGANAETRRCPLPRERQQRWGCLPRNETAAPRDASSTHAHVHLHYPCEGVRGVCLPSGELWSGLISKIPHQNLQGWGYSLSLVIMNHGVNAWISNTVSSCDTSCFPLLTLPLVVNTWICNNVLSCDASCFPLVILPLAVYILR